MRNDRSKIAMGVSGENSSRLRGVIKVNRTVRTKTTKISNRQVPHRNKNRTQCPKFYAHPPPSQTKTRTQKMGRLQYNAIWYDELRIFLKGRKLCRPGGNWRRSSSPPRQGQVIFSVRFWCRWTARAMSWCYFPYEISLVPLRRCLWKHLPCPLPSREVGGLISFATSAKGSNPEGSTAFDI